MNPSRKITVLLAEDHAVVCQGLRTLLESESHCEVVGEARTGREAVELAASLHPDVVLMDIAMPELNGIAATQQILAQDPAALAEYNAASAAFKAQLVTLRAATAETWDATKVRTGAAWQRVRAAYEKLSA